jgi:hypothetical protein
MKRHLEEICRTVAFGAHALVVSEYAGWHTTRAIVIPSNLSLFFLAH